jgi:hypothetical protein
MGGAFRHARLSEYVVFGDGTAAPDRVQGECVATEV